jgi:hypothetical protein
MAGRWSDDAVVSYNAAFTNKLFKYAQREIERERERC